YSLSYTLSLSYCSVFTPFSSSLLSSSLLSFPTRRSSDLLPDHPVPTITTSTLSSFFAIHIPPAIYLNHSRMSLIISKTRRFYFLDRKSTRLNSSHVSISYDFFGLKTKKQIR